MYNGTDFNYIIFDLELNSKAFKSSRPNEIIEIGAVKLDSCLQNMGVFQSYVRPKVFRKLFPVIKRKTKIKQGDINDAPTFKEVLRSFKEWIGKDYVLCSWGHDDIHHLKANCEFNRRGTKWLNNHIDIQKQFSKLYNLPVGQRFSLKNALDALDISVEKDLHRADVDAKYTAEIFIRVFDKLDLRT
jgi:3'-5' exoribonuclease 1